MKMNNKMNIKKNMNGAHAHPFILYRSLYMT